ncbi:hypothetical protein LCGC14_1285020 [marine sediment metagenome]|uniref:Uncharacterized protein n=1 Tax=marine sediment metagenome TaxID=412755 RepID=A0A0F9NX81_9ZZZZ
MLEADGRNYLLTLAYFQRIPGCELYGVGRGNGDAGIGEKVRRLERNQKFIITGLGLALSAAAQVAWEWARAKLTGGQL